MQPQLQSPTESKDVETARQFIRRIRQEPVWFAQNVLNHRPLKGEPTLDEDPEKSWEMDQFQKDILEACFDVWRKKQGLETRINHDGRNFITIRAGHGPGKTHLLGLIAFTVGSAFPARIIATAPKLAQLRTRLWGVLRKVHNRAEKYWRETHVIHDTAVYWLRPGANGKMEEDRNWCILAETATQPENLAGHHERFLLVLVDEATGVPEGLWPVIFGALSTGEYVVLVMVSNPTRSTGTFANSHLQKREEQNYFRYHINLANARRISRLWVASMERKYGKDSPVVAVRCHGNFPTSDPNQLVALEWITAAIGAPRDPDGSQVKLRVTVDVADGGEDETVITVAMHFQSFIKVIHQSVYNFPAGVSPIRAADKAEEKFREYGGDKDVDDFVVDSLGVGAGTAGTLMDRGYRVVRYVGGAASSDSLRWRNRRVQSYIALRNAFRDGRLVIAEGAVDFEEIDDLTAQLCSIKTRPEQDRVEDLQTKEQMKDDGIKSPDRADSLAMQFATQAPQLSPEAPMTGATTVHNVPLEVMEGYLG